jgi:hypothetical protein
VTHDTKGTNPLVSPSLSDCKSDRARKARAVNSNRCEGAQVIADDADKWARAQATAAEEALRKDWERHCYNGALGSQHVRDGWIKLVLQKGKTEAGDVGASPAAGAPKGDRRRPAEADVLVTADGKPFSDAGFGNWFRDRCDEAGCRSARPMACAKRGCVAPSLAP